MMMEASATKMAAPLLSETIRSALATDIAAGAIGPGTSLDEQQIADRFNASRTPVREALRQLAADGLAEIRPRRGVFVASLTAERISDMFEATAEIEAICVRLAAYRMTPLERSQLKRLHDASAELVSTSIQAYSSFNLEFHHLIYRGTHNAFLLEQALSLRSRMAAFRQAQLLEEGRPGKSFAEHAEIVEAILRSDGEEAAKRMRAHLFNGSVSLQRYVERYSAGQERSD
jgi:DNA-binding GntR family transcriptional regulator